MIAVRALTRAAVVALGAVTVAFAILHLAPGEPARTLVGPHATEETLARARQTYHLDEPVAWQYLTLLGRLARGDLGESYRSRRPVADILAERVGPTAQLALGAIALQLLLGIPLGVIAAARRGRWPDRLISSSTVLLLATPGFVLASLLLYFVGHRLGWLPILGMGESLSERLVHSILPTLSLSGAGAAWVAQLTRTEVLRTLDEDFVRSARAKGLSETRVVWHHALRPALPAVLAATGVELGALLTGAIAVEAIFGWPGLGREAMQAVLELDIPLVLGIVLVVSVAVALVNAFTEVLQERLTPR